MNENKTEAKEMGSEDRIGSANATLKVHQGKPVEESGSKTEKAGKAGSCEE